MEDNTKTVEVIAQNIRDAYEVAKTIIELHDKIHALTVEEDAMRSDKMHPEAIFDAQSNPDTSVESLIALLYEREAIETKRDALKERINLLEKEKNHAEYAFVAMMPPWIWLRVGDRCVCNKGGGTQLQYADVEVRSWANMMAALNAEIE